MDLSPFPPVSVSYLNPGQRGDGHAEGTWVHGKILCEELSKKTVLNANVLDYLLANKEIIPEAWKKMTGDNATFITFWGTIYITGYNALVVRNLRWSAVSQDWLSAESEITSRHENAYNLMGRYYDYEPAALLKS